MRDITKRFSLPLSETGEQDMTLSPSTTFCSPSPVVRFSESNLPRLEIETMDAVPFSGSFSALLGQPQPKSRPNSMATTNTTVDMSYDIDCFTDMKELDSQWEDDDVDEVLVLSPRSRSSRYLDTIAEEPHIDTSSAPPVSPEGVHLGAFELLNAEPHVENGITTRLYRKKDTCRIYCLKIFSAEGNSGSKPDIMRAVSDLKSSFFPEVHWVFPIEKDICVVTDYFPRKNLDALVTSCGKFGLKESLFYASELVQALEYLHSAHIIHRCLHPGVINVDASGHLVLNGFGYAQTLYRTPDRHSREFCLSDELPREGSARPFLAPELILGWSHDFAVDSWGFGMVLAFMLSGKCLFSAEDTSKLDDEIVSQPLCLDGFDESSRDLITRCLERSASARATLTAITAHKFFSSVDWSDVLKRKVEAPHPTDPPSRTCSTEVDFLSMVKPTKEVPEDRPTIGTVSERGETTKATYAFPVGARPDRLPKIFRASMTLDDLAEVPEEDVTPLSAEQEISQEMHTDEETVSAAEEPGQETPEQRMAAFWDDIDQEEKMSRRILGRLGHVSTTEVNKPNRPAKLRKARSSGSVYISRRLFPSFSSSSLNKKLRKRTSQPANLASSPVNNSGRMAPEPTTPITVGSPPVTKKLPAGVKAMGSGIGFSYNVPTASRSKVSICTTNLPNGCHPMLQKPFTGLSRIRLADFSLSLKRGSTNIKDPATQTTSDMGLALPYSNDASPQLDTIYPGASAWTLTSTPGSVLVISSDYDGTSPTDDRNELESPASESGPSTPLPTSNPTMLVEPGIVMKTEVTHHGVPIVPQRKLHDGEPMTLRLVPSCSRLQMDFHSYNSSFIPPLY